MNENEMTNEEVTEICEKLHNASEKLRKIDLAKHSDSIGVFLDLIAACAVVKSNLRPLVKVFLVMGLYDEMNDLLQKRLQRKNEEESCNTIGFSDVSDEKATFTDKQVLGFRA